MYGAQARRGCTARWGLYLCHGQCISSSSFLALDAIARPQILGTGVNSSGSLAPVNAPVASAQLDAAKRAFAQTGRTPQEVDFIELHATGMYRAQAQPIAG